MMPLRRSIFISATVQPLAPSVSSRDLSALLFNQAKLELSHFPWERNNFSIGTPNRTPGLWSLPNLTCGPERIQRQASTRNLQLVNKLKRTAGTRASGSGPEVVSHEASAGPHRRAEGVRRNFG